MRKTCTKGFATVPSLEIHKFLRPTSIAIVGVSAQTASQFKAGGRAVLDHLVAYDFPGDIWPVHPTASEIGGLITYKSLSELPGAPDCVVVAVSSEKVKEVIEECGRIGAHQALILTGGFSELGSEGVRLEASIMESAGRLGVRIVGPNSTGLVDVAGKVAMSMTSVLSSGVPLIEGGLAVIAQSGAIASSIVERARDNGVGISHLISIGNQTDVGAGDFLEYFADADEVTSVAMYLESIRNRSALEAGVKRMQSKGKAVVVLLSGRTLLGEAAASSHTGKLAGRGVMEQSLLRELGVTLVEDLDNLWRVGDLLSHQPDTADCSKWAVMSFSGGMGVLTVDSLYDSGAELARFSEITKEQLAELLPSYVQPVNPLDIGPGAMPDKFARILTILADDPAVEGICVPMPMGARGWESPIVEGILSARKIGKPILVGWYGGAAVQPYLERLQKGGILVVEEPGQLGTLVRSILSSHGPRPKALKEAPETDDTPTGTVGGFTVLDTLRRASLDVATMRLERGIDDIRAAASAVGYPVVVKSGQDDITHRLELGLVKINIRNDEELVGAVNELEASITRMTKSKEVTPFIVQKHVPAGTEVVLVVRNVGDLGWFGGIGLGGSEVELLNDIAFLPLPCTVDALRGAIRTTRSSELWFGFRGAPPLDLDWIVESLNGLASVTLENGWSELEVNPAIVYSQGGSMVDALAQVNSVDES